MLSLLGEGERDLENNTDDRLFQGDGDVDLDWRRVGDGEGDFDLRPCSALMACRRRRGLW